MAIRYKTSAKTKFGVPPLPSGYDAQSAHDITIPPVGIEDVDISLFKLLNEEISFQVSVGDKNRSETKHVPVIFGAGEKWSMLKQGRGIRDRNNTLILPLISIDRNEVIQDSVKDTTGRGINQQTGEIVIRRRLDNSDRAYQNIINRLSLINQKNLAVTNGTAVEGQVSTSRDVGDLGEDPTVLDGGLLIPDRKHNIFETIVIPAPQFYTVTYEVTFWAQYTVQMVQMLEQLMSSFLPQGHAWRLDTPKGYWFVATVEDRTYVPDNNFDDMSQQERIIKYKFNVTVPAYLLASSAPGVPVPIRRYISNPVISFETAPTSLEETESSTVIDPYLGADDPTLPLAERTRRADQRDDGSTRLYPGAQNNVEDPALLSIPRGQKRPSYKKITGLDRNGKKVTRYVRVLRVNRFTGETVMAPDPVIDGLTSVVIDDQ